MSDNEKRAQRERVRAWLLTADADIGADVLDLLREVEALRGREPVRDIEARAVEVLEEYHISQQSSDGTEDHHYLGCEPAEAVAALKAEGLLAEATEEGED